MLNIAVVGGGIVGATTAYYLAREGHAVTVFDDGTGQATSASAGIICPWLSKRRNKKWYRLAAGGAAFYRQLLCDLESDQGDTSFYHRSGAVLLKKTAKAAQDLYDIGLKRREEAPEIGDLKLLSPAEIKDLLPTLQGQENAIWVEGGARIDGGKLVASLLQVVEKMGGTIHRGKASLVTDTVVRFETTDYPFDKIVLAVGAWLPQMLEPMGLSVDIRGQKGQLAVLQTDDYENDSSPVIMPEGEIDILPVGNGKVFVGATHEDDMAYDLKPNDAIIKNLIRQGEALFTGLEKAELIEVKVGTRAYTSDFSPFFGFLPGNKTILMASGLGSSGLTTGPYIGYQLALLASGTEPTIAVEDYLPSSYIIVASSRERTL